MSQTSKKPSQSAVNRATRMMAVQAIYQRSAVLNDAADLTAEYLAYRKGMDLDGDKMVEPDGELLKTLIFGVIDKDSDLQELIAQNRGPKSEESEQKRALDPLLMACLLCGAYELTFEQSTDFPIIISDYVDVAKAFYEGKEPGLVNAVLDSIREVVRETK